MIQLNYAGLANTIEDYYMLAMFSLFIATGMAIMWWGEV